jgi:hypothetical protein
VSKNLDTNEGWTALLIALILRDKVEKTEVLTNFDDSLFTRLASLVNREQACAVREVVTPMSSAVRNRDHLATSANTRILQLRSQLTPYATSLILMRQ